MTIDPARRAILQTLGAGLAAGAAFPTLVGDASAKDARAAQIEPSAISLRGLAERLARAPRHRDFKTVPMILDDPRLWDNQAILELISYQQPTKQVWDNSALDSPWLNLMRNSLNTQVYSFKHANFLMVSATHGSAHFALYDAPTWEKYQLAKMAGEKFKSNTLIEEKKGAGADPRKYQDPRGFTSSENSSIPALMRRGVVFLACHNAIWEHAAKLMKDGVNPDKLTQKELAAELTNHLIDGVVLTPGAVATIAELQGAGFHYSKG